MLNRRSLLLGSAAVAAAPLATPAQAIGLRAHAVSGGLGGIVSSRFWPFSQQTINGLGTVTIPVADKPCLFPLSTVLFDESGGALFTLDSQMVTIQQTGKYRMTLSLDWGARYNNDIDLREYCIQRLQVGDTPPSVTAPPAVTVIGTDKWDRLACYEVPGSDSPTRARSDATLTWRPGVVPAGGFVSIDVPVTPAGLVLPGDAAEAGLSTLTSATLGPAVDQLRLVARVDAKDVVRVVLHNMGTTDVTVPQGRLRAMGKSLVDYRGRSTDAWLTVQTTDELLYAGEKIFCMFRSKVAGDFVQLTNQTFLQIEKVA